MKTGTFEQMLDEWRNKGRQSVLATKDEAFGIAVHTINGSWMSLGGFPCGYGRECYLFDSHHEFAQWLVRATVDPWETIRQAWDSDTKQVILYPYSGNGTYRILFEYTPFDGSPNRFFWATTGNTEGGVEYVWEEFKKHYDADLVIVADDTSGYRLEV